ncbi:hypothetical protein BURKHO8Y_170090 [Burkholderia sp. 8Y]|uniref:hypothetical protein n=1 Tax=Burkholderia sp. 8Y TaxID=2653133 RepID=UPI0012F17E7B|nr:hypothetical protein [Burkholderia sp. 8Y]VXB84578.1 hypothetical protein BURKHO8Y_170090 [Burkholderia sp. 8Y]
MSAPKHFPDSPAQSGTMKALSRFIFMSRWLPVPPYFGLSVAQNVLPRNAIPRSALH